MSKTEEIKGQLEDAGYDSATAVATQAEIKAGAACGQLSIITEDKDGPVDDPQKPASEEEDEG